MIEIPSLRPETRYGMPPADLLLFNRWFIVGYSYLFRQPSFALELLYPEGHLMEEDFDRLDNFREDLRVPEMFRSTLADYRGSGFDRGHLVSSANRDQRTIFNSETFLLTNMSPQEGDLNRQIWRILEQEIRGLADTKRYVEVYVICGPLFEMGEEVRTIGDNNVVVPHAYFKSVLAERADADRASTQLDLWTFKFSNEGHDDELEDHLVPTVDVERQAGMQLWDRLRGETAHRLKTRVRDMWDLDEINEEDEEDDDD